MSQEYLHVNEQSHEFVPFIFETVKCKIFLALNMSGLETGMLKMNCVIPPKVRGDILVSMRIPLMSASALALVSVVA